MATAPSAVCEVNPLLMGDSQELSLVPVPADCDCPGVAESRGCPGRCCWGRDTRDRGPAQPSWSIPGCAGVLCMWLRAPRQGSGDTAGCRKRFHGWVRNHSWAGPISTNSQPNHQLGKTPPVQTPGWLELELAHDSQPGPGRNFCSQEQLHRFMRL